MSWRPFGSTLVRDGHGTRRGQGFQAPPSVALDDNLVGTVHAGAMNPTFDSQERRGRETPSVCISFAFPHCVTMRGVVESGNIKETLRDTSNLVVAFSSLNAWGEKAKEFDWRTLADDETISSILVRDLDDTWYNRNPVGPSTDLRDLVAYVRSRARKYRRVVCIGSSMGAYAAIAVGKLIDADQVVAFSPQTLIDADRLEAYGDDRWSDYFRRLPKTAVKDLITLAALNSRSRTKIDIYVSRDRDDQDLRQAQNLAGLSGVTIHVMARARHNLVDTIRAAGLLRPLVAAAVEGRALPDTASAMLAFLALRDFDCSIVGYEIHPTGPVFTLRARITNTGPDRWGAGHPVSDGMRFTWTCQRLGDDYMTSGTGRLADSELAPNDHCQIAITVPLEGAHPGIYHVVVDFGDAALSYSKLNREPMRFHFDVGQQSRFLAWSFNESDFGHFDLIPGSVVDETNWKAVSHRNGDQMFFPVAGQRLKCLPGHGDADAIFVRQSDDAIVMFGPFIELEPARYRARVLLDEANSSIGAGTIEATGRRGTMLFASSVFTLGPQDLALTLDFDVPRRCEQSEIRVRTRGCRTDIIGLHIERLSG